MKKINFLLTVFFFTIGVCSQNDFCADAIEVIPISFSPLISTTGSFNGATISTLAPSCAPNTSQDVWYKFTATEMMNVITLSGVTGIEDGLEVYDTNCTGTPIICKFSNTPYGEYLSYNNYIIGHTYYIRFFNATATISSGNFIFRLEKYAQPSNDLCDNAITVIPELGTCSYNIQRVFSGSTFGAPVSCTPSASQDVWYKFIATDKMMGIFFSGNGEIDIACELYDGSCSGDLLLCRNYNGLGVSDYAFFNNFVIGNTYYLRAINVYSRPSVSYLFLCLLRYPAPANDDCANATELTLNSLCSFTPGTFSGASLDGLESTSCSPNSSQDVWYKFTATSATSSVTISGMSNISDAFEIYDGSCTGPMLVCRNNNGIGSGEIANYTNFIVGHQYYVRVVNATGKPLSISNFTICVQDPTLSVSEGNKKAIEVYPNPTDNFIEVSNVDAAINYELYNHLGQIIRKDNFSTNQINIQFLQSGIYLLKIFDGTNSVTKKIIKK